MGYYEDRKVLDTILGEDGKHKVVKIRYPSWQKIKILTVHLRRELVPRQLNISSGVELKTWMIKKGRFNFFFTNSLFKKSCKAVGVCKHCVIGAWAYIRVGTDTHVLWLKGKGKSIKFIKEER